MLYSATEILGQRPPYEIGQTDPQLPDLPIRDGEVPCKPTTVLGSTVQIWDWRAPVYDIYIRNAPVQPQPTYSPFATATDPNVLHLGFLTGGEPSDYELSKTDLLGRQLWRQKARFEHTGSFSLLGDFAQLTPATYILRVVGEDISESFTLQKQ